MRETKERKIMKCLLYTPKKTMGMQVALARGERDRSDAQDLSGVTVKICFSPIQFSIERNKVATSLARLL